MAVFFLSIIGTHGLLNIIVTVIRPLNTVIVDWFYESQTNYAAVAYWLGVTFRADEQRHTQSVSQWNA